MSFKLPPVLSDYQAAEAQGRLNKKGETLTHAPITGASPNNAGLDDEIHDAKSCSVLSVSPAPYHSQQPPQNRQRRPLVGTQSLTGLFGSPRNGDTPSLSIRKNYERVLGAAGALDSGSTQNSRFSNGVNLEDFSYSRDAGANVKNSTLNLERHRTSSPEDYRRSTSSTGKYLLNRVPEEMETTSTGVVDTDQEHRAGNHQYYGSLGNGTAPIRIDTRVGPRYLESILIDEGEDSEDEEEEEWLLDSELAKEGLYRGNYKNLVILYTFVPASTLVAFLSLALLAIFVFPSSSPSSFPYSPSLPFPLPEVLTATALWSLSYLLRDFLYATSIFCANLVPIPSDQFPNFIPVSSSIFSALLQSASCLFFRQLAVPLLLIPYYSTDHLGHFNQQQSLDIHKHHFPTWHDDAFKRVWWVALGWAAAEAVVGIKQGYESIALYKDVLVNVEKDSISKTESATPKPGGRVDMVDRTPIDIRVGSSKMATASTNAFQHMSRNLSDSPSSYNLNDLCDPVQEPNSGAAGERQPLLKIGVDSLQPTRWQATSESERLLAESEVERDLDELMALKSREELEEVYGIPVIRIPVFISCLHRINSILSSLGITLLLTAAYMRSTFAYHRPGFLLEIHPFRPSNRYLMVTLPPILILQTLLAMVHTPWILPKIGIHTFVYVGLLASLGLFFGGLGVWEALT